MDDVGNETPIDFEKQAIAFQLGKDAARVDDIIGVFNQFLRTNHNIKLIEARIGLWCIVRVGDIQAGENRMLIRDVSLTEAVKTALELTLRSE